MSFFSSKFQIPHFARNSKLEIRNSRSAFSLVELLLYVGIFATVMTVFTGIFTVMNKVGTNQSVTAEVSQQTQFVLQTIQRLVRQTSVIDVADNTPVTDLKLRMTDPTQSVVDIYLDIPTNSIKMKVHNDTTNTDTITDVTNNKVVANSLSFTKVATAGGHDVVQVSLTLTFNSQAKDQQISKTLNTAIARVSAATFDSDLIPNLDNSYSVGVTANRWKNAYFSGVVGIGTASPLSKLDINGAAAIGTYAGTSAAPANGLIVSGNVGIGTATPGEKLHLSGGTMKIDSINIPFIIQETDQTLPMGLWRIPADGGGFRLDRNTSATGNFLTYKTPWSVNSAGLLSLGESGSISILSTGNVGIGTTAPAANLDVFGTLNVAVAGTTFSATGGTITYSGGYTIHTFTTSGTFTPSGSGTVEYLVVAGGGSGGTSQPSYGGAGGGGAGGMRTGTGFSVTAQAYPITVGVGGAAQTVAASRGNSGGSSTFSTITTTGGGGGGNGVGGDPGSSGGSGGGAGYNGYTFQAGAAGTAGQGNKGGDTLSNNNGGGGGGAGGVGGNTNSGGPSGMGGVGGPGLSSSISGVAVVYAKGGEGGTPPGGLASGAPNTGNGGSGVYGAGGPSGAGGSGIVIIRYLTSAGGGSVDVLRTTGTGNVGIGTATPDSLFEVQTSAAGTGSIKTVASLTTGTDGVEGDGLALDFRTNIGLDATERVQARIASQQQAVASSHSGNLSFWTMNSTTLGERMRITETGNVGIGTGSLAPVGRLQVSSGVTTGSANSDNSLITPTLTLGTAAGSYGAIRLYAGSDWGTQGNFATIKVTNGNLHIDAASNAAGTYLNWYAGASGGVNVGNGAAGYGTIRAAAFTTASSRASKKDIIQSNYGIADVMKLNPIKFKYINDVYNKENIGLIADDVQNIIPEIVEVDRKGNAAGIDYNKISVVLIGAVKEQQKQIDDQNQRIKILESEIKSLKK